jgi:hypothetical protein
MNDAEHERLPGWIRALVNAAPILEEQKKTAALCHSLKLISRGISTEEVDILSVLLPVMKESGAAQDEIEHAARAALDQHDLPF